MRDAVRFLFEVGQLKRVARSGWWVAGVTQPESVAEHSFRCAWIGYLLARRDGRADPARVTLMCLMNDLHEARINDLHKVAQSYLDFPAAETKAFLDQARSIPEGAELEPLHLEYQEGKSRDAALARDADRLEAAFQALEYMATGHRGCESWIESARAALRTEIAREMFAALVEFDPTTWFHDLPRVP
jgi:putative hydrolase of HD superfamily